MADKLTNKQQMFVSDNLIDLNATQAAIRAGYSEKTAGSVGAVVTDAGAMPTPLTSPR